MTSCLRCEQAWCVQGPAGRPKGQDVREGDIAGGGQRCEVPAPWRRWNPGGHCHGAGRQGRCQGVLAEPWLAQVLSAWCPHGAEEVTGPQSGLQSSKGLSVFWFVATAEAGGPPMFSHTHILDHLCRRLTWANHLSSGKRRDQPLRARIRKSTFQPAVCLQRPLLAELNIVFTGQKARCWKACPLCEEWGQWGKLSAESQ